MYAYLGSFPVRSHLMAIDESAIMNDMYIYQLMFSFMWLLISYELKLNTIA